MKKYVIINADDFGLSRSVNWGVIAAFRAGIVTSASLFANLPGFKHAVKKAKKYPPLGVGLHFNLSYGAPVSAPEKVPSLVNQDGNFSYNIQGWTEDHVTVELEAQWNRCLKYGIKPTHIDSHQHIQMNKVVYKPMVRLAKREGIPMRHTPWDPDIGKRHPLTADEFICDEYFKGDGLQRLRRHLKSLDDGVTEIMCHPGYVDDDVRKLSTWTDVREVELAVFTDRSVANKMWELGLVPIHFGHLVQLHKNWK